MYVLESSGDEGECNAVRTYTGVHSYQKHIKVPQRAHREDIQAETREYRDLGRNTGTLPQAQ